jgi:uncharacterized protein YecE (DUF72 family)
VALWVGTSGYNYPEWRGSFYPQGLASAKMLPYYAERLDTVEINNTFYRMPTEKAVEGWRQATPPRFKLTLKAPKQITHIARLRDCTAAVARFLEVAAVLQDKRGALLFQLPPFLRRDVGLLEQFLATLPQATCAAFEFRHASWFAEETYACLRARNVALCVADSEQLSTPLQITADYGYFRLRDEGYEAPDLARWAQQVRAATTGCREVFVYFKHEAAGKGPQFARIFLDAWAAH